MPDGWVLLTRALYQTVLLAAPLVAVVLMVNGEALAGIAAKVSALGAMLLWVLVGPAPKPPRLSMRQPHVPLTRVIGVPVVPALAVMLLEPLVMEVVAALVSWSVTVSPAVSLVLAETVSLAIDCLPVESGVSAPSVTDGPDEYDVITGLTVRPMDVLLVCVSAVAARGSVMAARLRPARLIAR